jgi:hypothetical protein
MRAVMRSSRKQATRALDAVRRRHRRPREHQAHAARPTSSLMATSPRTIERALLIIDGQPPVRIELVAAASARLAAGERPSSEAIAARAIRVVTCDLV